MPAKRLPWFRFWIDATTHGKVRQLDDGTFRTWVELLDAAAKQPHRGRFDSRAEAVSIVRRPLKHIAALIAAKLVDETDEGLEMHDWDEWQRWRQDDANDYGTTPDPPPNDSLTTRNGHAYNSAIRVSAEGDTETETETERVRTPTESLSKSADSLSEASPGDDRVDEVYAHFKARVQPKSRLCPRKKIAARLKSFSVDELREGIDHFADDPWWMEHNADQGAGWFFESDARAEQFLLLSPRKRSNVMPMNGRSALRQGVRHA